MNLLSTEILGFLSNGYRILPDESGGGKSSITGYQFRGAVSGLSPIIVFRNFAIRFLFQSAKLEKGISRVFCDK